MTIHEATLTAAVSIAASGPKLREGSIRLVGNRWSRRVHEIKDFLSRSRVPYVWLDLDSDDEARRVVAEVGQPNLPVMIFPDGTVLQNPDVRGVAEKLGLDTQPPSHDWDLVRCLPPAATKSRWAPHRPRSTPLIPSARCKGMRVSR